MNPDSYGYTGQVLAVTKNSNRLKVVENKQVAKFFKRMVGILQPMVK